MKNIIPILLMLLAFPVFAQQPQSDLSYQIAQLQPLLRQASALYQAEQQRDLTAILGEQDITAEGDQPPQDIYRQMGTVLNSINRNVQRVESAFNDHLRQENADKNMILDLVRSSSTNVTVPRIQAPTPYVPPPVQPYVDPRILRAREAREVAGPDNK